MEYIDIDKILPKWEDYFTHSFPPMEEDSQKSYALKEDADESSITGKNNRT